MSGIASSRAESRQSVDNNFVDGSVLPDMEQIEHSNENLVTIADDGMIPANNAIFLLRY